MSYKYYYVNKNPQSTGEHEVHNDTCEHLPEKENRMFLGVYDNCKDAVNEAKKYYSNVDGCFYCCYPCNKK